MTLRKTFCIGLLIFCAACGGGPSGPPTGETSDFYQCYQAGNCSPPALSNAPDCLENRDYSVTRVIAKDAAGKDATVTVLSFHGGNIEPNTSEISNELSNRYVWSRYDFKAHATSACTSVGAGTFQGNKLHITSTHFDDPQAVSLVSAQPKAVALHGYSDSRGWAKGVICVGGNDVSARNAFISYVNDKNNAAAWNMGSKTYPLTPIDATTAADGTDCGADEIRGLSGDNLVNRTKSNAGLQLELNPGFRADLVDTSSAFDSLRNLIYEAIHQAMIAPTGP